MSDQSGPEYEHLNDKGELCDCIARVCVCLGETDCGPIPACPACRSTLISLCCGNHGYRCGDCKTTFLVP